MEEREKCQLEWKTVESSVVKLQANLEELNQKKTNILKMTQSLRERANKEGASAEIQNLFSLLASLKALEKQEADVKSHCKSTCSKLQAEINELDEVIRSRDDSKRLPEFIDQSLGDSIVGLQSVKRVLAAKLREIVSLKRRIDDVPTQAELIQYDRRLSELNVHIQGKLRQTRKYYATYNALLEIKDLMLKETSPLNSISSQFQDAITSPAGRTTLIKSMEGILNSIQQKLEKVQLTQQAEQKACEALKEKHAAANSEQRRCYGLLKAFQEECAKNERLRAQTSEVLI